MEQLTVALTIIALLAAATWFQFRLSKRRAWTPLWQAFSSTFAAALFLISGSIGYRLDGRTSFLAGNRWSDTVIWWEIGMGLLFAAFAVLCWRLAIRHTDRLLTRA